MKITKEHIGKKVKRAHADEWLTILDVFGGEFWAYRQDLGCTSVYECTDSSITGGWELYEETNYKPFIVEGREVKVGDKLTDQVELDGCLDCYLTVTEIFPRIRRFRSKNLDWGWDQHKWKFYEEPKPKKLLAPAILKTNEGSFYVGGGLYSSEKEARGKAWGEVHSWPAIPNKDGFYEV